MSTPFKMKGFSGFGDGTGSPMKKKVVNEDGSTTRTRKNLLTGRTRIVTKGSDDDGHKTKSVAVIDKKGTVRKEKTKIVNPSQDNIYTSKTKYKKSGERKSSVSKHKSMTTGKTEVRRADKKSLEAFDSQFNTNINRNDEPYYNPGSHVDAFDVHGKEVGRVVTEKKSKKKK
jgi:hypothetical protein